MFSMLCLFCYVGILSLFLGNEMRYLTFEKTTKNEQPPNPPPDKEGFKIEVIEGECFI